MNIRYRVTLTTDERLQLETMIQGGTVAVRRIKRAQILLAADQGSPDEAIASNVAVGTSTVYRTGCTSWRMALNVLSASYRIAVLRRKLGVEDA